MKTTTIIFAAGLALSQSAGAFAVDLHAPEFLSTSLPGSDGKAHNLNDWRGKIRIVNFWATWCAPCRNEIPVLSATDREWRAKNVEVIGVAMDDADDVRAYSSEAHIAYPILFGEQLGQGLMQSGGNAIGALPFTVLLDRRGNIIQRHAGAVDTQLLKRWLADASAKN